MGELQHLFGMCILKIPETSRLPPPKPSGVTQHRGIPHKYLNKSLKKTPEFSAKIGPLGSTKLEQDAMDDSPSVCKVSLRKGWDANAKLG